MVVAVDSAVVGSCAGGLFKFELAVFGTADDFGAGVSCGGKNLTWLLAI